MYLLALERERDLLCTESLLKWPQHPGLVQMEATSQTTVVGTVWLSQSWGPGASAEPPVG